MFSDANALLMLAVVLVAGVAAGFLVTRIKLPAVTGQIVVGIIIGPSGLALFGEVAHESLLPMTHFALGLIAVAVGNHLNFRRLRNAAKRLTFLLLAEATVTPLIVFLVVLALPGTNWPVAFLLAAMAVSTAPATIVALIKETRAKGVFVNTLVAAVALNNIACICLFEVARSAARVNYGAEGHSALDMIFAPLRQVGISAVLGIGFGLILLAVTWRVFRSDRLATASIVAILLTSGLAGFVGASPLLACLFLGLTLANVRPDRDEIGHRVFDDFESAILAVFFTLAGMDLHLEYVLPGGAVALAVVAGRFIGKVAAGRLAMRLAGATVAVRRYLGVALVPQAGVAVGLMILVQEDPALVSIAQLFLAVGLTSVTANEIIGPILTRIGLSASRDAGMDRPRLIDFIHEENIVTDFWAADKTEAIEKLTDLLLRTHNVSSSRDQLLTSVLEREREASTCIGQGLSIPHGVLSEGNNIAGVMAISSTGLQFETPDGKPVHCMVLLATPEDQRDRHLEVLAVLARVIGSDRNIRKELFGAESAAHAFDILHVEAEDFNPFLEESS